MANVTSTSWPLIKVGRHTKLWLLSLFFCCFEAIPRGSQGFLLSLCSVFTSQFTSGPMWGAYFELGLAIGKANALSSVLSLWT